MGTINALSCNRDDVQAAVYLAADGDTVIIPAGAASWASPVTFDGQAIVVKGAGVGQTTITDAGAGLFRVNGLEGKPFRISGFAVDMSAAATIHIRGTCKNWRVDHVDFEHGNGLPLTIAVQSGDLNDTGYTCGVVDHCYLGDAMLLTIEGIGHDSWKRPLGLGTDLALYVEDCEIYGQTLFGHAIDANHGGRYVFRHNKVTNYYVEAHSLQNQDATLFARATRSYEVYRNKFYAVGNGSPGVYVAIALRGGTGVVFENEVFNQSGDPYNIMIGVDNVRSFEHLGGLLGDADGSNPLDGNELPNGYPALDQIGRSTDHGAGDDRHPQELDPLYAWDNYMDGVLQGVTVINNCGHHIQEGRDFYNVPKPGYAPLVYPHPLVTEEETQVATKSIPFTLEITEAPDFFPAVAPSTLSVPKGIVAVYNTSFTAQGGFTGPVTLAVINLPAGAVGTFDVTSINLGQTATLSITTADVAVGVFTPSVEATAEL